MEIDTGLVNIYWCEKQVHLDSLCTNEFWKLLLHCPHTPWVWRRRRHHLIWWALVVIYLPLSPQWLTALLYPLLQYLLWGKLLPNHLGCHYSHTSRRKLLLLGRSPSQHYLLRLLRVLQRILDNGWRTHKLTVEQISTVLPSIMPLWRSPPSPSNQRTNERKWNKFLFLIMIFQLWKNVILEWIAAAFFTTSLNCINYCATTLQLV